MVGDDQKAQHETKHEFSYIKMNRVFFVRAFSDFSLVLFAVFVKEEESTG